MPKHFILWEGFSLLFTPHIRRYVIWPMLVNILLFSTLFYGSYHLALYLHAQSVAFLPSWLSFLAWLVWPVMLLLVLLMFVYGFSTLSNLLAAPFNALLSEAVERKFNYTQEQSSSWQELWRLIPSTILREGQKILYCLPWWILALILSFIPVVNILSLLIGAWLIALQYLDYPADNHKIPFPTMRQHLQRKRVLTLSFGSSVLLCSAVPLLNLFVMPASVCAATLLWHRAEYPH